MFKNIIRTILTRKEKDLGLSNEIDIGPEGFKEKKKEERGVIIDVRTIREFNEGHLKEADFQYDYINGEFHQKLESLDKENTYYLYCRSGNRSGQAARVMKIQGFENVYNIGGFRQLVNAGFETKK